MGSLVTPEGAEYPPFQNPPIAQEIRFLFAGLFQDNMGKRPYKKCNIRKTGEVGFNGLAGVWFVLYFAIHNPEILLLQYSIEPFLKEINSSVHRSAHTYNILESAFSKEPTIPRSDPHFWEKVGMEIGKVMYSSTGLRPAFYHHADILHETSLQIKYHLFTLQTGRRHLKPFKLGIAFHPGAGM